MNKTILSLAIFFVTATSALHAADRVQLGLQTWTCRNMSFEQVIEFATNHGIKNLELIAKHLDPAASREETLRKKALLDRRGLVAYSFGVNAIKSVDKNADRQLFEFARLMGIKLIIVEPRDLADWDNLEALVKEYDIKLAIHNHGTGTTYGNPATVRKILAERDHRIGVCLDIGWVTAAGFDAAKVFHDYGDRVFDLHYKDKKPEIVDGKTDWTDTLPGRGSVNLTGLFAEIHRTNWNGVLALETDSPDFARDPNTLMNCAAEFFRMHTLQSVDAK